MKKLRQYSLMAPASAYREMNAKRLLPFCRPTAVKLLKFLAGLSSAQRKFCLEELPALLGAWTDRPELLGKKSERLSLASDDARYYRLDAMAVALLHLAPIYVKEVPAVLYRAFQFDGAEKMPSVALGDPTTLTTARRALTSWTDSIGAAYDFGRETLKSSKPWVVFETNGRPKVLGTPKGVRLLIGDAFVCQLAFPNIRVPDYGSDVRGLSAKDYAIIASDLYDMNTPVSYYTREREYLVYSTQPVKSKMVVLVGSGSSKADQFASEKYRTLLDTRSGAVPKYGYDPEDTEMKRVRKLADEEYKK